VHDLFDNSRPKDVSSEDALASEHESNLPTADDDPYLVKIAREWKRRDRGRPEWWTQYLMGLFR